MKNRTRNPSVNFERGKLEGDRIAEWLDSGQKLTDSELATYQANLQSYGNKGRQDDLPFSFPGDES